MTATQTLAIVSMVTIGTVATRFLPFIIFKSNNTENSYIDYLGKVLPYSVIGLLLVYCLKGVSFKSNPYGIPEVVAIGSIVLLHHWKGNTLLSIGVGTGIYMLLVQGIFV